MFRKLDLSAIARLNDPNQGMNYKGRDHGQRKYNPDTGKPYYTPSRPATLTIYGERAETVMAIIENCETVAAALATPTPPVDETDRLEAMAQAIAKESGVSDWRHVSEHGEYDSRDYWRRLARAADRTQGGEVRRG